MQKKSRNTVSVSQLANLEKLLNELAKNAAYAREKVVATKSDTYETTNWETSGLRGSLLLCRFLDQIIGGVESMTARELYDKLEREHKDRVGYAPAERVKIDVAAEPATDYQRSKKQSSLGGKDESAKKKRLGSDE